MSDFTPTAAARIARLERESAELRNRLHAIYSQRFPRTIAPMESLGVPVKHVGNQNCPPGGLMRIVGTENVDGVRHITIDKPNGDYQRHYLVNRWKELEYGETGVGLWAFDRAARIKLYTGDTVGTPGQSFGAVPNQWYARLGYYGFRSTGKRYTESGQESFEGMQMLDYEIVGKTDAAISKGLSGVVSVWLGSRAADTTQNITASVAAATVGLGKWVGVAWLADSPTIVWTEC